VLSKIIAFLKSRPTEVWLGLWTAIVGVFVALDVEVPPELVAAISALIGWIVTFVAANTDSLGPQ